MAETPNVFDAFQLTSLVLAGLPASDSDAGLRTEPGAFTWENLAPAVNYTRRRIRVRIDRYRPFGAGMIKAPNAAYPIAQVRTTTKELWISAVDFAEQVIFQETHALESADALVAETALQDTLAQGRWLLRRNARTEELMRRDVLWNQLNFHFPNGATIGPLATYNGYASTHIVSNAISWATVATATPLNDIRTWRRLIKRDSDNRAAILHINEVWYHNLRMTTQMRNIMPNVPKTGSTLPTKSELADLLEIDDIIIYDGGWTRESDGVFVDMMRNGYVLLTTAYVIDGDPIVETGRFPIGIANQQTNRIDVVPAGDADLHIVLDPVNVQEYMRCHTARMCWINRPDAIVLANVNAGA
jgi:hypothetical protein